MFDPDYDTPKSIEERLIVLERANEGLRQVVKDQTKDIECVYIRTNRLRIAAR